VTAGGAEGLRAYEVTHDESGRPSSERDGACICDYNPATTEGPVEECPFHGRAYGYWIERGDALAEQIADLRTLLAAQSGPEVVGDGEAGVSEFWRQPEITPALIAEAQGVASDLANPTPAEPRGDAAGLEAVLAGHRGVWRGFTDWHCSCSETIADERVGRMSAEMCHNAHLAAVIVEAGWKR